MKISFVYSSTLISYYVINYYIIARYKLSSMSNINNYIHTSIGILYYVTQEVGLVFLKSGLK